MVSNLNPRWDLGATEFLGLSNVDLSRVKVDSRVRLSDTPVPKTLGDDLSDVTGRHKQDLNVSACKIGDVWATGLSSSRTDRLGKGSYEASTFAGPEGPTTRGTNVLYDEDRKRSSRRVGRSLSTSGVTLGRTEVVGGRVGVRGSGAPGTRTACRRSG